LRSFEVRNEGLFELKFALCDFNDEEAKKKIRDERQKETFKAKGTRFYESTLALDISSRDPADRLTGIPFEVYAESSIPAINREDWDNIFEEQTVVTCALLIRNTIA
jgi:hypothetical protein